MARVYGDGERAPGDRFFLPIERTIYRLCGVDERREQRWTTYAYSLLAFSLVSFLVVYAVQRLQGSLPFNPSGVSGVLPHLSFNTAVSFMTNTNWQSYGGETTMSHLTQMIGLTVQNFVSAAAGMAVMAAFIRGLARRRAKTIGNFWVDLTRSTVRILLPLALVVAVVLISQGVIQNFHGHIEVTTVEGSSQVLAGGPAAGQVAIKQLGTNGGGFFNVNSAHPFENSTPFGDFVEMFCIVHHPVRPGLHVRAHGQGPTAGPRRVRHHGRDLGAVVGRGDGVGERTATPSSTRWRRRPGDHRRARRRRQPRGQGGPLRSRRLGAVGGDHDRHLERLRQLDARQHDPARRRRRHEPHDARRGQPWRRRRRAQRPVDHGDPRRSSSPA